MSDTAFFRRAKVFAWSALAVSLVITVLYYPLPPILSTFDRATDIVSQATTDSSQSHKPHWHGWVSTEHMVVFGDSLTSTWFNVRGDQPSQLNPLGNPDFPGKTSTNGPNWVGYLTGHHNASFLKTVNLAAGGATVDGDIVSGMLPMTRSFKDQITKLWVPYYVPASPDFDWIAENTLFVSFLGTNDIGRAFLNGWTSALGHVIDQYCVLLEELYKSGARNFLMMTTLPLDRAPFAQRLNNQSRTELTNLVQAFNSDLHGIAATFRNDHTDVTMFVFDTQVFLGDLIDEPCGMESTCPLKETTTYCGTYVKGESVGYDADAECEYAIDEYFWLNTLHPSTRVHDALAKVIFVYLSDAT